MADVFIEEAAVTQTPLAAIDNAVKETIWDFTKVAISQNLSSPTNEREMHLNELVKSGTKAMCLHASREAAYKLASNSRDLFQNIILVSTENIGPNSWLNRNDQQYSHSYFLAQGIDGNWYAGSPANHDKANKNYALTIIHGKELDSVIRMMNARDGVTFPSSQDILFQIEGRREAMPQIMDKRYSIFEIKNTPVGLEINTHNYST